MHVATLPTVDAIFFGGPQTLHDRRGAWRSSIKKHRADHPVEVTRAGIAGDKATKRFHGGPDAALCVHLADHYAFWRDTHDIDLAPGAVGENLTVSGITEDDIFVGDTVRLGTVLAEISGPRVPCVNQARFVGRTNWVKLTLRENRTGFYMRVLEPGTLQPGAAWQLVDRRNEDASIPSINRCMYHVFNPTLAERMLTMSGLAEWWRQQAREKLVAHGAA